MTKIIEDSPPEGEDDLKLKGPLVEETTDLCGISTVSPKAVDAAEIEDKKLSEDVEVIKGREEDQDEVEAIAEKCVVKNWVTLASGLRICIEEECVGDSDPFITGIYFEGGPETGIASLWDCIETPSVDGQSYVVMASDDRDSHKYYVENPLFRQRGGAGAAKTSGGGGLNVTFTIAGGQGRGGPTKIPSSFAASNFAAPDYLSTIFSGMRAAGSIPRSPSIAQLKPQVSQFQMPTLKRPTTVPRVSVGGPNYHTTPRATMINQNPMACGAYQNPYHPGLLPHQMEFVGSPPGFQPNLHPPLRTTGGGMCSPPRFNSNAFPNNFQNISDQEIAAVAAAAMSGDSGKQPQVIEIIRDSLEEGTTDDCVVIELGNEDEVEACPKRRQTNNINYARGENRKSKSVNASESKAPIIIVTGNNPNCPGVTASGGGLKSPVLIMSGNQKDGAMSPRVSAGDNVCKNRCCGHRVYGGGYDNDAEYCESDEYEENETSEDDNYQDVVSRSRPCSAASNRTDKIAPCTTNQYSSTPPTGRNQYFPEGQPQPNCKQQRPVVASLTNSPNSIPFPTYTTPIHNSASSPAFGFPNNFSDVEERRLFGPRLSAESITGRPSSRDQPMLVRHLSRPTHAPLSNYNHSSCPSCAKPILVNPLNQHSPSLQYGNRRQCELTSHHRRPMTIHRNCVPSTTSIVSVVPNSRNDESPLQKRYEIRIKSSDQQKEKSLLVQAVSRAAHGSSFKTVCEKLPSGRLSTPLVHQMSPSMSNRVAESVGEPNTSETTHSSTDISCQSSRQHMHNGYPIQPQRSQSEQSMSSQGRMYPCVSTSSEPDFNLRTANVPQRIPDKMKKKLLNSMNQRYTPQTIPSKLYSSDVCDEVVQNTEKQRYNPEGENIYEVPECTENDNHKPKIMSKKHVPEEKCDKEVQRTENWRIKTQKKIAKSPSSDGSMHVVQSTKKPILPPPIQIREQKKMSCEHAVYKSPIPKVKFSKEHARSRFVEDDSIVDLPSNKNDFNIEPNLRQFPPRKTSSEGFLPSHEETVRRETPMPKTVPHEEYFTPPEVTYKEKSQMRNYNRASNKKYTPPQQFVYGNDLCYTPQEQNITSHQNAFTFQRQRIGQNEPHVVQVYHTAEKQNPQSHEEIDAYIRHMVQQLREEEKAKQNVDLDQQACTRGFMERGEMLRTMDFPSKDNFDDEESDDLRNHQRRVEVFNRYIELLAEVGASKTYQNAYAKRIANMPLQLQIRELEMRERQLNEMTEDNFIKLRQRINQIEELNFGEKRRSQQSKYLTQEEHMAMTTQKKVFKNKRKKGQAEESQRRFQRGELTDEEDIDYATNSQQAWEQQEWEDEREVQEEQKHLQDDELTEEEEMSMSQNIQPKWEQQQQWETPKQEQQRSNGYTAQYKKRLNWKTPLAINKKRYRVPVEESGVVSFESDDKPQTKLSESKNRGRLKVKQSVSFAEESNEQIRATCPQVNHKAIVKNPGASIRNSRRRNTFQKAECDDLEDNELRSTTRSQQQKIKYQKRDTSAPGRYKGRLDPSHLKSFGDLEESFEPRETSVSLGYISGNAENEFENPPPLDERHEKKMKSRHRQQRKSKANEDEEIDEEQFRFQLDKVLRGRYCRPQQQFSPGDKKKVKEELCQFQAPSDGSEGEFGDEESNDDIIASEPFEPTSEHHYSPNDEYVSKTTPVGIPRKSKDFKETKKQQIEKRELKTNSVEQREYQTKPKANNKRSGYHSDYKKCMDVVRRLRQQLS